MERRTVIFLTMLAAAGGGPFLLLNDGFSSLINRWKAMGTASDPTPSTLFTQGAQSTQPEQLAPSPGFPTAGGSPQNLRDTDGSPIGPPTVDIQDAFDFNITPRWVINRWPRVSPALTELNMKGMRVPLVTGTRVDDLHGSLTYYFDDQQRLQRVTFHGHTGDASKLIALLTEYHQFKPERTLEAGLLIKRWNWKPTGVVLIEHAPVVRAESPTSRLKIRLEINRPDRPYKLSNEFAELLEQRQRADRLNRASTPFSGGILARPDRPGHFVGNTVRYFYRLGQ